jgi:hypothetical protein
LNGLIGTETLTLGNTASGTLASANAGSEPVTTAVTISNGTGLASNYTLTQPTLSNVTISPATLTLSGTRVYDGTTIVAGSVLTANGVAGQTFSVTGAGNLSNLTSANVQTGSTLATLTGLTLGSSSNGGLSSNYSPLSTTGSSISITQLGTVYWVGGTTGYWSTPSNWAANSPTGPRGAIPDYANVANVVIPLAGSTVPTVTYNSLVPGSTTLSTLTSNGNLLMAAGSLGSLSTTGYLSTAGYQQTSGTLNVGGNFSTAGYTQSGGTLNVGGNLSINSTAGGVTLGNIGAGSLSISSTAGPIAQSASTALNVTGTTALHASSPSTIYPINDYNITLANAGNNFAGAVTSYGLNINLLDKSALSLGDTNAPFGNNGNSASGNFTATSLNGAITETPGTSFYAYGNTNLTAGNGSSTKYNITMLSTGNYTGGSYSGGAVTANGSNISLQFGQCCGQAGLILGNITAGTTTAPGNFTALSTTGAITQAVGTTVDVTGTSTLTAVQLTHTGAITYNITLGNKNDFMGAVTANGSAITLDNSAPLTAIVYAGATSLTSAGALNVGGTVGTLTTVTTGTNSATTFIPNAVGTATTVGTALNVTSTGPITQAASTAVNVGGATTLTASGSGASGLITLANTSNSFGGAVASSGSSIDLQSSGGLILGTTAARAGGLTITSGGPITQSAAVNVTGTGATSLNSNNNAITLTNASNSFGGAVSSTGSNIDLVAGTGGLMLGATMAAGMFTADSLAGAITQAAGTAVNVGTTSLTANKAITLTNASNSFGGTVTATGSAITLDDALLTVPLTAVLDSTGASALTSAGALNVSGTVGTSLTTTTTGTGSATNFGATTIGTKLVVSSAGPITQSASTGVDVTGTTSLTAPNYGITLANASTCPQDCNSFGGAVSSTGSNIDLVQSTGGLKLGNTAATGLTADSLAGAITQVAGTTVDVTGATSLTANNGVTGTGAVNYNITLANANNFGGTVTATGSVITLDDAAPLAPLTAVLDSTGASALTSVGPLNVSGTVGTKLTTTTTGTTGTGSATTFGATTVGTTLVVTSTGAVTETSPNILTVDGEGTTNQPSPGNKHVTVNGVVAANIP